MEYAPILILVSVIVVMTVLHIRKQRRRQATDELITLNREIRSTEDSLIDPKITRDKIADAENMKLYKELIARQSVLHKRMGIK